ncbi:MAG: hypothetical protein R3B70_07250 [Polyangiaceae bacterium]
MRSMAEPAHDGAGTPRDHDAPEDAGSEPLTMSLIDAAAAGDPTALRTLVHALVPIVQKSVARTLLRRGVGRGRDVRQEVDDLAQEAFAALFADRAHALRQWSPDRGRSLPSFVSLLAERTVASILRTRRRSPWTEDPLPSEDLDGLGSDDPELERRMVQKDVLSRVVARLRERLTPRSLDLFDWLILDERPVAEVCELSGMNADAVYAFRNRLGRMVREIARELASESEPSPRK